MSLWRWIRLRRGGRPPAMGATAWAEASEDPPSPGQRNLPRAAFRILAPLLPLLAAACEPPPPLNRPPTADAGIDQSVAGRAMVVLDGSGSSDPDDDADTLKFSWAGPQGVTFLAGTDNTPIATFVARNETRTLTFHLTVDDPTGHQHEDTVRVNVTAVPSQPPIADAGHDRTVGLGETVTLDGTGSMDPEDDPLTFSWRQMSGGPLVTLMGADTATPTFTAPADPATLRFLLIVADGSSIHGNSVAITVTLLTNRREAEHAPAGTGGPKIGRSNASGFAVWHLGDGDETSYIMEVETAGKYDLIVRYSNDEAGLGDLVTVSVQGDRVGTFLPRATGDSGLGWNVFVESPAISLGDLTPGELEIALRLDSPDGSGIDVDVLLLELPAPTLIANAGDDQTVGLGETVTLDGTGSTDPDGDALTFSWTQMSGGPPVTLVNSDTPTPTFTAPAEATTLRFLLTVHDGNVTNLDGDVVTITVAPLTSRRGGKDAPRPARDSALGWDVFVEAPAAPSADLTPGPLKIPLRADSPARSAVDVDLPPLAPVRRLTPSLSAMPPPCYAGRMPLCPWLPAAKPLRMRRSREIAQWMKRPPVGGLASQCHPPLGGQDPAMKFELQMPVGNPAVITGVRSKGLAEHVDGALFVPTSSAKPGAEGLKTVRLADQAILSRVSGARPRVI